MNTNKRIQYITCLELENGRTTEEYNLMMFRRKKLFNKISIYKIDKARRAVDIHITGRLSGGYKRTFR